MNSLRKPVVALEDDAVHDCTFAVPRSHPDEAFAYEDDVTPEGIECLRRMAKDRLSGKDWKVIDGYAGDQKTRVD